MAYWKKRRKRLLVGAALAVVVAAAWVQRERTRVDDYTAGEATEGVVDRLARHVPDDHPQVRFEEVGAELGIAFEHFPSTRTNRLVEDMGSGVALADVDGDGWTDVFAVGADSTPEGSASRLFLNRAGRFEDHTTASGIDERGLGMAAAFADLDGDGDLDLATTRVGGLRLWHNDGGARFADRSAVAGFDLPAFAGRYWAGLAVADLGLDGDLDLYVCGYVVYDETAAPATSSRNYGTVIPAMINPSNFAPEHNLLLVNDGALGFIDRALELDVDNPEGRSLGAIFSDLNADGRPDLYVANDVSDNAFFLATPDGGFRDETHRALIGDYRGAMGLAAADIDGDLDVDLFVTHWVAQENALYTPYRVETGADGLAVPVYLDASRDQGLGFEALEMVGWAAHFLDFDNDGRRDLLVVNGSTIPLAEQPTEMEPMRSQLFWRHPERRGYFEIGPVAGDFFREPHVGRGGAGFDLDLDGDEDLVVALHGEGVALLRNDGDEARRSERHALRLRLRQPAGNRFAIGARVELEALGPDGMLTPPVLGIVGSDGSYLSQHAVGELHFGLGRAALVERLTVTWPDGTVERAGPFAADSLVTWTRGTPARIEPLPGRLELDRARPSDPTVEREFFAIRKRAGGLRLAGDHAGAVRAYREALALWPGHGDANYYLGNSLLALGREREALETFERCTAFAPEVSSGWMQLGLLRMPGGDPALDDLDLAAAAFERNHALNQEEARPVLMLGIVALLEDELERAGELFADAAAHNPRSVAARWFAGRVAWRTGDRAAARAWLEAAHAVALDTHKGDSVSSEGDTATGAAMLAAIEVPLAPELTRWRGLAERSPDPASEYD